MISVSNKQWSERKFDDRLIDKCSQDNNFSQVLSKLVISRKFNQEEIYTINDPKNVNFSNVFKFSHDFNNSINLVLKFVRSKEKICILGDYDVDGSCATALFLKFFNKIKHPNFFCIPDRKKDGYGPSIKLLKKIIKKKPKLIIMVDCGSNANKEVEYLNKNKIYSIIIDHHQISKPYPNANFIINPNKDNEYKKYEYICATSLTYFFLDLLKNKIKSDFPLEDYLIYVLLATVCDVMPLRNINRFIAIKTLNKFDLNKIIPIKKIYETLNKKNKISINDLGYLIGPILNAGGRLGIADYAVKLLSSDDNNEIKYLTKKLIKLNINRKKYEEIILKKINYKNIEKMNKNVIVYYNPTINEGLIGIIAARLKEIFNKPSIVLTDSKNFLKGSARSIFGFDIGLAFKDALDNNIILNGGGHKMAAGFSINKKNLETFDNFINIMFNRKFNNLNKKNYVYESKVSLNFFNKDLNKEINKLSPYGPGNAEPIFLIEKLKIVNVKILKEKHIFAIFKSKNGFSIPSIYFNSLNESICKYLLNYKKEINVIGYFNENFWNNKKTLQLVIRDLII